MWRATIASILTTAVLGTAPAQAQTELPVGESDGVAIRENSNGTLRVVFTKKAAKLYRRIAGKRITIACWEFVDGESGKSGSIEAFRAPKRRSSFRLGDSEGDRFDYCRVLRGHGDVEELEDPPIVSVPLSQRGAVFLDEQLRAHEIFGFLTVVGRDGEGWPTFEELSPELRAFPVVKLTAPGDTPPKGRAGYYSDGGEHAAVVTLSASGRRLYVEVDVDKTLRTNVAEYIYGSRD